MIFYTLSCLLIRSMKKLQQLSRLSMSPNPLSSIRIDATIISTSSSLNRSGISPKTDNNAHNVFIIIKYPNNTKSHELTYVQ